jgi:hypothetical protein
MMLERLIFIKLSGAVLIAGVLAVVIFMWPELTPWYRPS